MVTGSFFCICLERPKYFYIAADKAVYLKINSESVSSHRETVYSVRCLSVLLGLSAAFSWGCYLRGPGLGGAPTLPGGPGRLALIAGLPPACLGCEPRERPATPTLTVFMPAPGTRGCEVLWVVHTVVGNSVGGKGDCGCSVFFAGRSFRSMTWSK